MPRSGTTWIARVLAAAPGTALGGREPMNPRPRQYALGGTLSNWARLEQPTRRQAIDLRLAYRGINPWVFSRYGRRQWAAPWPGTRIIVKDPFAALSLPMIAATTGARALVTYRHPGAMLVSFRRVGWRPGPGRDPAAGPPTGPGRPARSRVQSPEPEGADVRGMAAFWAALYDQVLADLDRVPGALLISHEELASGGEEALRALYAELGLRWSAEAGRPFAVPASPPASAAGASAATPGRHGAAQLRPGPLPGRRGLGGRLGPGRAGRAQRADRRGPARAGRPPLPPHLTEPPTGPRTGGGRSAARGVS